MEGDELIRKGVGRSWASAGASVVISTGALRALIKAEPTYPPG